MAENESNVRAQDRTGLDAGERNQLAEHLARVLADTYILMIKTHVYHWNVTGIHFGPLHELTESHYEDLFKAADVIAERIRALGHLAPMSIESMLPKATVEEEQRTRRAAGMIAQLVTDHEKIVGRLRETATAADKLEDYVTTDMLTERMAFHEKAIWMLRAMIDRD